MRCRIVGNVNVADRRHGFSPKKLTPFEGAIAIIITGVGGLLDFR